MHRCFLVQFIFSSHALIFLIKSRSVCFHRIDPTRTLLSLYASVNMKDMVQHNTPLHWACLSQNTSVVMLLIKAGADLNAKNDLVRCFCSCLFPDDFYAHKNN